MKDDQVIDAFVEYLGTTRHPGLTVDRRPDKLDRSSPAIDAIAGPFAIEHTSLEVLPDQRRNDSWYERVVGPLEREFGNSLPYALVVSVPYDTVSAGGNWNATRQMLREWIRDDSGELADGRHSIERPRGGDVSFHVWKRRDRRGVYFKRQVPAHRTPASSVREQLLRKASKLANCRDASIDTRILLVENGDLALMTVQVLVEMVQAGFPDGKPVGVDELWYADTSLVEELEFRDLTTRIWLASR